LPVHAYTVKAGTTSKSVLVFARSAEGGPRTGLAASEGRAGFIREGAGSATPIPLVEEAPGAWSPGGFSEVDPELLPGLYQVGLPDEVLSPGSSRAVVMVTFPDAHIDPVDVDLVAFDPQDDVRLGLSALGPAERVQALRRAFPRLTAEEMQPGADRLPD